MSEVKNDSTAEQALCINIDEHAFLKALVMKLRSFDTYGTWKKLDDVEILQRNYVREKSKEKALHGHGDKIDERRVWFVRMLFEAAAYTIEQKLGCMMYAALDINHEGFGRALIISGDYVLCCNIVRSLTKFTFKSLEGLADFGEKTVQTALSKAGELGLS